MSASLKITLHAHCLQIVERQLEGVQKALKDAQGSANNETKSSAGDKHETGRAMAQLETEKLTGQLSEVIKLKETLFKINSEAESNTVAFGSLVLTNKGLFYIAIGLGKVVLNDQDFFVVSPISPIGKVLINKKEKESFSFNGNSYVIEEVI